MPDPIPRGPFDQGLFLAHFNKGRELFEARRFDEAELQLEEAYLLRPRDQRVLNLLGLVYFREDKLDKAEEVYRKLIAESPGAHTLHYNLGLICLKLGRLEDAESAFLKALELTQGNPKVHFYLGSIYERLHRYKDAIYQYREAGANLMVQRVEGKIAARRPPAARGAAQRAATPVETDRPDGTPPMPPAEPRGEPSLQTAAQAPSEGPGQHLFAPPKVIEPVSPSLMADGTLPTSLSETARFRVDDTLPPTLRARQVTTAPASQESAEPSPTGREVFRALEKGLMEVDFSGKVFLKQGTIYSYSGNLTFWVKEKRPGGRPALVIATGTGRLILTDGERDITFVQVDEPLFVESSHLLACEESLQPRYVRLGEAEDAVEVVALDGQGMLALSVASKPLPLTVRPGLPVSVPAHSVIMWTGRLTSHVVDDPQVYEVILASSATRGRLLRLEGTGRILVEQATA
jgi:uncharacterized protein (AIM24 family)